MSAEDAHRPAHLAHDQDCVPGADNASRTARLGAHFAVATEMAEVTGAERDELRFFYLSRC